MKHWRFAATLLLLACALAAAHYSDRRGKAPLQRSLEAIPNRIGDWVGSPGMELDDRTSMLLNATTYLSRVYRQSGVEADLFIAFYAHQHAGESMHPPRLCLLGAGWEIWRYDTTEIPAANGPVTVNQYSIQKNLDRMLVLYWYQSRRRIIANEYLARVLLVKDTFLESDTSGSIVRVIVPDRPGMAELAAGFAAAIIPQVQVCLGPLSAVSR